MLDRATGGLERRRNDVAAVGECRRAEDDHHLSAGREHLLDRTRELWLFVRHAFFYDDGRARGRDARGGDLQRLLDDLRHKAWHHGRDDADLANAIWCDPYQRRGWLAQRRVARLG